MFVYTEHVFQDCQTLQGKLSKYVVVGSPASQFKPHYWMIENSLTRRKKRKKGCLIKQSQTSEDEEKLIIFKLGSIRYTAYAEVLFEKYRCIYNSNVWKRHLPAILYMRLSQLRRVDLGNGTSTLQYNDYLNF